MKNKEIIGIDVSKATLDLYILSKQKYFTVDNNPSGFSRLLEFCCIQLKCQKKLLFFCFEDTGRYSRLLSVFLHEESIQYSMVSALDVKQSKGLVRGKSDRKDAKTLATYASQRKESLASTLLQTAEVSQLRQLIRLREKLMKHRTSYKNSVKDLTDYYKEGESDFIRGTQQRMIDLITQEIEQVERRMDEIIDSIPEWSQNVRLIRTVKGVGVVLARFIIIYTENFSRFTDPKKFACYAGIAPFEYSSGSSIKGKTRVHHCANKKLKSLLNVAAMSAIQQKGEYKEYYQRRGEAGKNNMSTLNVIRNKLLLRVFAVVKRQTAYVDLTTFAA
jgi:transposase